LTQAREWNVVIHPIEDSDGYLAEAGNNDNLKVDSLGFIRYCNNIVLEARLKGFLLCNLDSVDLQGEDSRAEAWIYVGKKYKWEGIALESVSGDPAELESLDTYKWLGKDVSTSRLEKSIRNFLRDKQNKGYPFASIGIDSIKVLDSKIKANLRYEAGPLILYDSLNLNGDAVVKKNFLSAYIGTPVGSPYSQEVINDIPNRLGSIDFLTLAEPPIITFQNEEARINLLLEREKANRFDAIIGFLPNENGSGNLLITGAADLYLTNLFQSGKQLEFHWNHLQKETQTLSLGYKHPNLFLSPLGLDAYLYLYKQDTSFLNRKIMLSFNYRTGAWGSVSLHTRWESSRLISTRQYEDATTLPDLADFNVSYLGLGFTNLPETGLGIGLLKKWGLMLEVDIGSKTIVENPGLGEELYAGLDMESLQFSGRFGLEGIYALSSGPLALYGRLSTGLLKNDQLFLNDLFRLGGLNSLRGFNEYTFYASEYIIGTIEARAYFNRTSNLFAFFDMGHLSYEISNSSFEDNPFGTGMGLRINTDGGVFSFVYALGKSNEQPLSLRYSKIHFGYKAIF
jgi:outer membrane translocation and assembly module TamA